MFFSVVVNSLISVAQSWPSVWIPFVLCFGIYCLFDTHNNNITFQGKYQVSAELKDKEINNLKEELKSLQVLRCTTHTASSLCLLSLYLTHIPVLPLIPSSFLFLVSPSFFQNRKTTDFTIKLFKE